MPLPLPQWSVQDHNVTLKKVTYLENFPAYIQNRKNQQIQTTLAYISWYKLDIATWQSRLSQNTWAKSKDSRC